MCEEMRLQSYKIISYYLYWPVQNFGRREILRTFAGMNSDYIFHDAEFGGIEVRTDSRARRFVFRSAGGRLQCTSPRPYSEERLRAAVDGMRARLRALVERCRDSRPRGDRPFDGHTAIDAGGFRFRMEEAGVAVPTLKGGATDMVCLYPRGQRWDDERLQAWLRGNVERRLRVYATGVLGPRLEALAAARGLRYSELRIRKTRSRWGSCDSRGRITLSLYLMRVPPHLQDYVMQHELTHLVEMNHSGRFWALLDSVCGGRARQLRQEMKAYDTSLF